MVFTGPATPVIPSLVDRMGQTVLVERAVGMLETFLIKGLDRIWMQFPAPHSLLVTSHGDIMLNDSWQSLSTSDPNIRKSWVLLTIPSHNRAFNPEPKVLEKLSMPLM